MPQARTLYPFTGADQSELSFQQGEVLTVYSQNGEWWDCDLRGRRGLAPANYLQLM
jgi:hypothetical protein